MMLFKTILSFSLLLAAPVFSQSDEEALRDLQVGMAGLQEAAKNPALNIAPPPSEVLAASALPIAGDLQTWMPRKTK